MDSKNIQPLVAPSTMTMERVSETKQLIVAQSTSQCCRTGCCQPSINWVLREADKYVDVICVLYDVYIMSILHLLTYLMNVTLLQKVSTVAILTNMNSRRGFMKVRYYCIFMNVYFFANLSFDVEGQNLNFFLFTSVVVHIQNQHSSCDASVAAFLDVVP